MDIKLAEECTARKKKSRPRGATCGSKMGAKSGHKTSREVHSMDVKQFEKCTVVK